MSDYKQITITVRDKSWERHKASKTLFNALMKRMNESEYLWEAVEDIRYEDVEKK